MEATSKQIEYIESMKAEQAATIEAVARGVAIGKSQMVFAHLAIALPAPATLEEAREQIEALKGSMQAYSKIHREWAEPIVRAAVGG